MSALLGNVLCAGTSAVPAARPGRPEDAGSIWYLYERQNNAQAVAESLAPVAPRLNLGMAIAPSNAMITMTMISSMRLKPPASL